MKLYARHPQDEALTDPYTVLHFSAGLATGLGRVGTLRAVIGAAVVDYLFSKLYDTPVGIYRKTGHEPPENKVADIAIFALGNYLGRRWTSADGA